jgi:hypothetical protein
VKSSEKRNAEATADAITDAVIAVGNVASISRVNITVSNGVKFSPASAFAAAPTERARS